jgi:hypothetical protein
MLAGAASLHQAVTVQHQAEVRETNRQKLEKLGAVLRRETETAQTLLACNLLRVQPQAKLRTADGEILAPNNFLPQPESDAVTMADPDAGFIFRRVRANLYCREQLSAPDSADQSLSQYQPFLTFSVDGVGQQSYRFQPAPKEAGCNGNPTYSAYARTPEHSFFFTSVPRSAALLLIPLRDIFTLYLARDRMLRRFSHLSGTSQAVTGPFTSFRAGIDRKTQLLRVQAETESELPSGRIKRSWYFPFSETPALYFLDMIS